MTQIQIQIRYKWAKQAVWVRQYKLIEHPAQGNRVAHGHGDGNMLETQKNLNLNTDMEFVKKFTPLDFQAKNFIPSISPNFNSFGDKTQENEWKWRNLHRWQKTYTPAGSNGRDKSHLWLYIWYTRCPKKLTSRKKNPNQTWVLWGQVFPWKWRGSTHTW